MKKTFKDLKAEKLMSPIANYEIIKTTGRKMDVASQMRGCILLRDCLTARVCVHTP
jgi:hypothetical protein